MSSNRRPLRLPSRAVHGHNEEKRLWNKTRTKADADFYTLGYAGRSVTELIALLESVEVRSLIDIRYNPVSMYKPELSKTNLQKAATSCGFQYLHMRHWGVPRDIRAKAIETGDRQVIWEWYDTAIVQSLFGRNLHTFLNVAEHPVALMCVEADPSECHRHRLFVALEERGLRGFDL